MSGPWITLFLVGTVGSPAPCNFLNNAILALTTAPTCPSEYSQEGFQIKIRFLNFTVEKGKKTLRSGIKEESSIGALLAQKNLEYKLCTIEV